MIDLNNYEQNLDKPKIYKKNQLLRLKCNRNSLTLPPTSKLKYSSLETFIESDKMQYINICDKSTYETAE